MATITLENLLNACRPGGASVLTSVTPLAPAAGEHASVAPAKFVEGNKSVFAYERRFWQGAPVNAVLIDSKQSQLNRGEEAIATAIRDSDPTLSRVPRIELRFEEGLTLTDFDLPHRAFDGQIRAGTINGKPATEAPEYLALRDATPGHARALMKTSPNTLLNGGWDASRKSHQGRYRSILVGEIIGVLADQEGRATVNQSRRGGARIDPVGMRIALDSADLKAIADAQKDELSKATYDSAAKKGGKPSVLGLGGIPPVLDQLGGVTCRAIIRSHVLSFASLRALRFDCETPEGDVACRAVLAALGLAGLARSDAELRLRANCDLVEAGPAVVTLDKRYGEKEELDALTIEHADALLTEAMAYAEEQAGLVWDGSVLVVDGNPAVLKAATADESQDA